MEVSSTSGDRLEFRHDGIARSRPLQWIIIGCVILVAIATLLGGSFGALVVVIVFGAVLVALIRASSAQSTAVFDLGNKVVTISHVRPGKPAERAQWPLSEISRVIVEAAGRSARRDRVLNLRPALVIGTTIVPLTWRAFGDDKAPFDAALAIRRFLGHAEPGLFEDSIEALAKLSGRVNPAVRIARLGLGLNRREAANLVTRMQAGATDSQAHEP